MMVISNFCKEEAGLLTFEWILLLTILVIGVIGSLAAVREALNCELADVAQGIVSINQSYTYSGSKSEISQGVGAQPKTFFDVAWIYGSAMNDGDATVELNSVPASASEYVEDGDLVPKD